MEQERDKQDLDEFETLLGEIPRATCGNSHSEEPNLCNHLKELKKVPLDDSLSIKECTSIKCRGRSSKEKLQKEQNNGCLDDRTILVNITNQTPSTDKMGQLEDLALPDGESLTSAFTQLDLNNDMRPEALMFPLVNYNYVPGYNVLSNGQHPRSLTSAFEKLDFNNGVRPEAVRPPMVNYNCVPGYGALSNGQYLNCSMNPPSNVDPKGLIISQPHLTMNINFDRLNAKMNSQHIMDTFKLDAQESEKQQTGHFQQFGTLSEAFPLVYEMQGFHYFPNVPIPGEGVPIVTDQQQFLASSALPYMHAPHLSQPWIAWRHGKDEEYHQTHQQYIYTQEFHNQQEEAQHPTQANWNAARGPTSHNSRQSMDGMPISHQCKNLNQGSLWDKHAIPGVFDQSSPLMSYVDSNLLQTYQKLKQWPQRFLTRSQGFNSMKDVKFGSVGGNGSYLHTNQNGRFIPNGNLRTRGLACFQLDNLRSSDFFLGNTNSNNANLKLPQLHKCNSLEEVTGSIYLMAKDQHGCRLLQKKFTEGTSDDLQEIFDEIIDHIIELMMDPFGNYLVQKLLEICGEDQWVQIISAITRKPGELVRISCDMHGTRAVQKVIETLKTQDHFSMIVSSLKPGILNMIKNMNGNHVAQRCLQHLKPEHCEFIFEAAITNCVELAIDRHGCCVLQKCLSYSNAEQKRRLVYEIASNALILSQDPFGNYVVQFVFDLRITWGMIEILDQLEGNYGDLSVQKYSSNVVEKCLKFAGEEHRSHIITELVNNARLDCIMQDPYGNYVIQAALDNSKGVIRDVLIEAIRPHVSALRSSPYGKKVLSNNGLKK